MFQLVGNKYGTLFKAIGKFFFATLPNKKPVANPLTLQCHIVKSLPHKDSTVVLF